MQTVFSMFLPLAEKPVREARQIVHWFGSEKSCLAIRSTESATKIVLGFLLSLSNRWGIEKNMCDNIIISVSEAVQNAVRHGNTSNPEKNVIVHATRDELHFTFTVEDEGSGFDHRRIKNPTDDENRSLPGGRGIFLMRQMTDLLQYSNEGRRVKLIFCR